jgi:hypothetical protein
MKERSKIHGQEAKVNRTNPAQTHGPDLEGLLIASGPSADGESACEGGMR